MANSTAWSLKRWIHLAQQDSGGGRLESSLWSLETDGATVSVGYQPICAALNCSLEVQPICAALNCSLKVQPCERGKALGDAAVEKL